MLTQLFQNDRLSLDPGYPLASTLIRMTESAGFRLTRRLGNFFAYTLVFEKP